MPDASGEIVDAEGSRGASVEARARNERPFDCAVARDREDDGRGVRLPGQGDRHHLAGAGGDRRRRAGTAAVHGPLVRGETEASATGLAAPASPWRDADAALAGVPR